MKVLLIEDDKFFQKFYSAKLKEQNVEIDTDIIVKKLKKYVKRLAV